MNSAEVSDLQRRLANLCRVGKIVEVDRSTGRVKVEFDGVKTPWMPWQTARAGAVKSWSPPSVGEQVSIISPMGELSSGFVMSGSINYDGQAAPDDRENVEKITLPEGGAYEIEVGGTTVVLDNGKVRIESGGKTLELSGGKLTFDGNLEVTGSIIATGEITSGDIPLSTHRHTGVETGGGISNIPIP